MNVKFNNAKEELTIYFTIFIPREDPKLTELTWKLPGINSLIIDSTSI